MSWMLDQAEALKAAAQERRNRGLSTGKPAAGWNAKRAPSPARGSWEYAIASAKADVKWIVGEALDQFRWHAYGDPWDETNVDVRLAVDLGRA